MKWCPCCKMTKQGRAFYRDIASTAKHKLGGYCKRCRAIKAKEYRSRNRDKIIAYLRRYYALNPARHKNYNLMQSYGITLEDFSAMVRKQKGRCAICRRHHTKCPRGKGAKPRVRLYVDHDHRTGKVRGLLCHNCNGRLDRLATPRLLIKSAKYLQQSIKR